jgi:glycosyl transferase family 25
MKTFIICLSKVESSLLSALETKAQLESYGFNPKLFEGTYGDEAESIFKKENRTFHPGEVDSSFKHNSPGVKGCFYSHYRLWQKCVELNEDLAIFEDDVVFKRPFVPVEFNDVLVLSINYDWLKIKNEYSVYLEKDFDVNTSVNYRHYYMPGCSGYVIKPHLAKLLLDTYKTTFLPADWAINSSLCKITLHPQLMGRSKTMDEKVSLTRKKDWI